MTTNSARLRLVAAGKEAGAFASARSERFKVGGLTPVHDTEHPGFAAGLGILLRIP
jgi:hypothetical protein